jgi:hypothetical protein
MDGRGRVEVQEVVDQKTTVLNPVIADIKAKHVVTCSALFAFSSSLKRQRGLRRDVWTTVGTIWKAELGFYIFWLP